MNEADCEKFKIGEKERLYKARKSEKAPSAALLMLQAQIQNF
jgi:hypothetical protein